MGFRGFVAVHVPAGPALRALIAELEPMRHAGVKPVDPERLHFTLSFLGQVPDEAREPLAEAIAKAVRGIAPFDVALRGVGAFPNARHPRVVWVGVEDPRPLVALALRVREEVAAAGVRGDDKDFRAHLTLARIREGARAQRVGDASGPRSRGVPEIGTFLRVHGGDAPGALRVEDVRLYESTLSPQGPTYETLATAPLEA